MLSSLDQSRVYNRCRVPSAMKDDIGIDWTLIQIQFHLKFVLSFCEVNNFLCEVHFYYNNISFTKSPRQRFLFSMRSFIFIGMTQRYSMNSITFLSDYIASTAWTCAFIIILFDYFRMTDTYAHKTLIFIISIKTNCNSIIRCC